MTSPRKIDNIGGIAGNLDLLMEKEGISEAALARKTGIPQPTLHKILAGKTADPRISTIQAIADYFNISTDYLLNDESSQTHQNETRAIPVVSWDAEQNSIEYIKDLTPNKHKEWLSTDLTDPALYALTTGASFEFRFPKGTMLIVNPLASARDGDLLIVHYSGTKHVTIRQFIEDGPVQLLSSLNPNSPSDRVSESTKILGVIIQSRYIF